MRNIFDEIQFSYREDEVRNYMRLQGVTTGDLARACDVSPTTVRRWLKSVNSISDWYQIIDQISEHKSEWQESERCKYREREAEVRGYMRRRGVSIADLASDARCSRSKVTRDLKSINSVTGWFKTVDRIADIKQERPYR